MSQVMENVQEAMKDQAFIQRILQLEEPQDVQKAFAEKGIDLTLSQVETIGKVIMADNNGDEISEDELENVSGGITLALLTAIIAGITVAVKIGTEIKKSGCKW